MRLNIINACPSEKIEFLAISLRCHRLNDLMGGLPYDDTLIVAGGALIRLYATDSHTRECVENAISQARRVRGVVEHQVVICPIEWFSELTKIPVARKPLYTSMGIAPNKE